MPSAEALELPAGNAAAIRLGERSFEGPFPIGDWIPRGRSGVYGLMVADRSAPASYRPVYFGETPSFAERAFPHAPSRGAGWLLIADYDASLHVAVHWMPRSSAAERAALVRQLIGLYHPECNEALHGCPLTTH